MTAILTGHMNAFTNGLGQVIGWTDPAWSGGVMAYIAGADCAARFLGEFPHAPAAHSAILDHAEEGELRRNKRNGLIRLEIEKLNDRIKQATNRITRMNKTLLKETDPFDRTMIRIEITMAEEEIAMVEGMVAGLRP